VVQKLYEDELRHYFGRINLGIASKYLLTAALRADGSNRFWTGNKAQCSFICGKSVSSEKISF
jgi:iron complex outermembrane receptor protein